MTALRAPLRGLALAAALSASACTRKQEPMAESWQLDRLRVLAVRADPAEPRPGESVSFTSLTWQPEGALQAVVWFACLPENASDFGCDLDPALLEGLDPDALETMSDDELADLFAQLLDAGLIGAEPYLPPRWTAPADALDGLDDIAAAEGVNALVTLQAIPEDVTSADDIEIAYKRVPISLSASPNRNPDIAEVRVDGAVVPLDETFVASPTASYEISVTLADDALETYSYLNTDGQTEEREEEPYLTWYTSSGTLTQTASLYPETSTVWTASNLSGEGDLIAVLRDRRGGMGWATLRFVVP